MKDADQLRDRATRLFALALKARDYGFSAADDLADLANEASPKRMKWIGATARPHLLPFVKHRRGSPHSSRSRSRSRSSSRSSSSSSSSSSSPRRDKAQAVLSGPELLRAMFDVALSTTLPRV